MSFSSAGIIKPVIISLFFPPKERKKEDFGKCVLACSNTHAIPYASHVSRHDDMMTAQLLSLLSNTQGEHRGLNIKLTLFLL